MKIKKNAFEEASDILYEKIQVPKSYLDALYYSQKFEFYLKWILTEYAVRAESHLKKHGIPYNPDISEDLSNKAYIKRIKTFLPFKENRNFYDRIDHAIGKRNKFVHNCFMPAGLNLDMDVYHLNEYSLRSLKEWVDSYIDAEPVILSVLKRVMAIK